MVVCLACAFNRAQLHECGLVLALTYLLKIATNAGFRAAVLKAVHDRQLWAEISIQSSAASNSPE